MSLRNVSSCSWPDFDLLAPTQAITGKGIIFVRKRGNFTADTAVNHVQSSGTVRLVLS